MQRFHREERYHQNKSLSPQRKAKKEAKLALRRQSHAEILLNYQHTKSYYSHIQDQKSIQAYYSSLPKEPTYEDLYNLLSSTFSHARRRDNIFPIVDRHPDYTLRCAYSGKILSDQKGEFMEKCDEEHSFPQSFQRGSKAGTGRDMHAIFAVCKSANGTRGNMPFGLYSEHQKPIHSNEYGTVFSSVAPINKKTFIPALNSGAVARSTLYILVCYKNSANESYLPKETLVWLIEEACNTEVTEWEKHRNQELFRLQGNRNPFIDYPGLAKEICFEGGWRK